MHEDPADGPLRFREHADLRILDPRLRELSAEQPPPRALEEETAVDAHGLRDHCLTRNKNPPGGRVPHQS